jgi:hypothetical protein
LRLVATLRAHAWKVAVGGIVVAACVALARCRMRSTTPTIDVGFDRPVTSDVVDRAVRLIAARAVRPGVKIAREGDVVTIDAPDELTAFDITEDVLLTHAPKWTLREDDGVSPYMFSLASFVAQDPGADKLGITATIEHDTTGTRTGAFLSAVDDFRYVNSDWATAHHCDTKDRIEGTGVGCIVPGRDRLAGYISGDAGLFIVPDLPAELAVPADHEMVLASGRLHGKVDARMHYCTRTAISLGATLVDHVAPEGRSALRLTLNARGSQLLAARPSQLPLLVVDGVASYAVRVETHGGATDLVVTLDADEIERVAFAWNLALLPAPLVLK